MFCKLKSIRREEKAEKPTDSFSHKPAQPPFIPTSSLYSLSSHRKREVIPYKPSLELIDFSITSKMKRRSTPGRSEVSRLAAVSAIWLCCLGTYVPLHVSSFMFPQLLSISRSPSCLLEMIAVPLDGDVAGNWRSNYQKHCVRKKYKRKREKPQTEKDSEQLHRIRQAKYEEIKNKASGSSPSIFSFESLFPEPVFDEATVHRDLYEVSERDGKVGKPTQKKPAPKSDIIRELTTLRSSSIGGSSMMRAWREPKLTGSVLSYDPTTSQISSNANAETFLQTSPAIDGLNQKLSAVQDIDKLADGIAKEIGAVINATTTKPPPVIDLALTRMVEDRVYGYRRSAGGAFEYDTSLMGDGAVKFRDGVRLANPLRVNADRLTYHARKELARGRVEEAQELYEKAIEIDPRDGRAYLGLSRVAERRRDFKLARECLRAGIANSVSVASNEACDRGENPFLLQALGCLEEKMGHLSEAEALYISAAKSRPSHAPAWVSLAQLRVRKLRQSAAAGRVCYQTAERELKLAGRPPSAHVYTAWASMEYKKAGDVRRARELFEAALKVDPKCSAALLQLGVMEADKENWKDAEKCFERVLKFDQRNSRVLQAYAIMETKRPDGDSRKAIGLFERALKANPRDAGVLQAYALFVAKLGDIDSARDLLRAGTEVNKRHAAVWQAWGVLETRYGSAEDARGLFQEGIWACAQMSGMYSGGYSCARLWQAWGVLEAREGDHAAARRCFSRALDADNRNVAAITAWTLMEEELGNYDDARLIFDRSLKRFPAASDDKMALWRAYELMEQRAGNTDAALQVFQGSMRESMGVREVQESFGDNLDESVQIVEPEPSMNEVLQQSKEVEVVRWGGDSDPVGRMSGEVWMNNGSIEGKVPMSSLKKKSQKRNSSKR